MTGDNKYYFTLCYLVAYSCTDNYSLAKRVHVLWRRPCIVPKRFKIACHERLVYFLIHHNAPFFFLSFNSVLRNSLGAVGNINKTDVLGSTMKFKVPL